MKKFCSKCGNQLDLGKKACPVCHAFNPFFIAGYTSSAPEAPIVETTVHEEVIVTPEPEIDNEIILSERLERERIDLSLKSELLRVKEETEQYKKETLDLVKDVKKELEDIDNENKLLKEKVKWLKSSRQVEVAELNTAPPPPAKEKTDYSSKFIPIAALVLAILIAAFSYFVLNSRSDSAVNTTTNNIPAAVTPTVKPQETKKPAPAIVAASDTAQSQKLLAVATPAENKPAISTTTSVVNKPATITPAVMKPSSTGFSLTASRITGDLVGKRLSGCDITVNSASEIEHVDNLTLVEKLSASYLKYKCTVKIKQGSETYTSSPYMYYSAEGTFIKVDGTNCE